MVYYKIDNLLNLNGSCDYKGLDTELIISNTQFYPENIQKDNFCILASQEEIGETENLRIITEVEYNEIKQTILESLPISDNERIVALEQEVLNNQLALVEQYERNELQQQDLLQTQIALAELYESMNPA